MQVYYFYFLIDDGNQLKMKTIHNMFRTKTCAFVKMNKMI